nr:hypothetical protein [uncultured Allomuricauda sp.]
MRPKTIIYTLLFVCLACKDPKEGATKNHLSKKIDSTEQHYGEKAAATPEQTYEIASEIDLYDPYDFTLQMDSIKVLLGNETTIDIDYIEDEFSRDSDALITMRHKETEINFYQFQEGKHSANITTPKLSVLKGIRVGIPREVFLTVMQIDGQEAAVATKFIYTDIYGAMEFFFENNTLSLIKVYYEEGD